MAIIKCKMCGGDLVLLPDSSVCECEYCGTRQTVPCADNEKKLVQFERAERLRKQCEFDKAAGVYESIVSEFRQEAEAYWSLVLCKYGIEYVDDPATGKKIPTCHRSSYESIFDDPNFELTMENADAVSLQVYRQEAKAIEEIRKGILTISGKEKPYDIFICYKETDAKGDRTVDSLLAQTIYDALNEKGYRVFFSRISLEDKLGVAYEPYIFSALHSAKIMLVVGTCYEYFNAVWVKNEWSRFLKLMAADRSKALIPCYKNIDAYDIPREFAHLQGQDMGKVGAMQDLVRGIEKMHPLQKKTPVNNSLEPQQALLERAKMFLGDRKWSEADAYCEKVLDLDPRNAMAYLYKLMASLKVRGLHGLDELPVTYNNHEYYIKALQFADADLRKALEDHRKEATYRKALQLKKQTNSLDALNRAAALFSTIAGYKDAEAQKASCQALRKEWQDKLLSYKKEKNALQIKRNELEKKQSYGGVSVVFFIIGGVILWFIGLVLGMFFSGVGIVFFIFGLVLMGFGLYYSAYASRRKWNEMDEIDRRIKELDTILIKENKA